MHMSMSAWRAKYGLPPNMSREEGRVQYVPDNSTIPHLFDTLEYMAAQPDRTAWLSRRMRRALEYIEVLYTSKCARRKSCRNVHSGRTCYRRPRPCPVEQRYTGHGNT